jgi:uncharacterized membrane protein
MNSDTQSSKERVEMLCDGVFAIAMTVLVLELKVPDLPKGTPSVRPEFAGLAAFPGILAILVIRRRVEKRAIAEARAAVAS